MCKTDGTMQDCCDEDDETDMSFWYENDSSLSHTRLLVDQWPSEQAKEIMEFKDWYDKRWLADSGCILRIPTFDDGEQYVNYMAGYRVGLAAWIERAKRL